MGGVLLAILITGGAGYIGTHICLELLKEGYDIIVIDNFSNSNIEAVNRVSAIAERTFKVYRIDLINRYDLMQIFAKESIDSVIHLAGYKSVNESKNFPLKYYSNNIAGTITLCEVMQQFGVKNLVFSSSATVYSPSTQQAPISETHPLGAINPYGQTKQIIETILKELYSSDPTWSICILRYFNPIGAHESGQIGEDPKGVPNNLMPYISKVAIGTLPTLYIYGNDYPTHDGTGVRDYIHVEDLARGHLHALFRVINTSGIDVFNLGTGKGYSVLEMIRTFEQASGIEIPYTITARRTGDVAVCYADVKKAKEILGWEAKKGIDAMCADAWGWQQNNPDGYGDAISHIDENKLTINNEL
jgi:UDP-glucose 4-epimerase